MAASRSIHGTLLAWLATGLAIALVAAAALTYRQAHQEANALFDLQLKQTAASILGMPIAGTPSSGTHGEEGLIVQIWDRSGVRVYLSKPSTEVTERMPERSVPGFATIDTPSGRYRVFSVLANGQLVQVGQPLSVRNVLAAQLALSTILPLAIVAPLIGLLVWLALRRGLAPLTRVTDALQRRAPGQLAPLDARGWPREIEPVVAALNGLLGRLDHAHDAQRAFVADAAHELRTPLAALALQAQLAQRAEGEEAQKRALADLRGGLARATHVVEQLLTLARAEPGVVEREASDVDLAVLARDTVASLTPLAAAKRIDVGIVRTDEAHVRADRDALSTMIENLVDNAIRYTSEGGRVDVAVAREGDDVVLRVRDNGRGIPLVERTRVFERFSRGSASDSPGTGLGLAIVARIAERHGAAVSLGEGLDGRGLEVTVRFRESANTLVNR